MEYYIIKCCGNEIRKKRVEKKLIKNIIAGYHTSENVLADVRGVR